MSTEELQRLKNELLREQQPSHRPSSREDCQPDEVELIFDQVE